MGPTLKIDSATAHAEVCPSLVTPAAKALVAGSLSLWHLAVPAVQLPKTTGPEAYPYPIASTPEAYPVPAAPDIPIYPNPTAMQAGGMVVSHTERPSPTAANGALPPRYNGRLVTPPIFPFPSSRRAGKTSALKAWGLLNVDGDRIAWSLEVVGQTDFYSASPAANSQP